MLNLRQLACAAVLLACTLAVTAAPVVDMDVDEMDLQAREWDSDLNLREYTGDNFMDAYYVNHLAARAPPKNKPARTPKKAAPKKAAPKKAAPKKTTPKKTTPKKTGGPRRKPTPKKPAARPPQRKPGNGRPNRPAQNSPSRKPTNPPNNRTKKPQSPAGASCPFTPGRKGKRAVFDASAQCTELTIGSTTRGLTKVTTQGNSAITYRVGGAGWPDPSGTNVVAYAKTGPAGRPKASFADEIKWLQKTDQLLAEGEVEGRNWIVFRGVEGKVELVETAGYVELVGEMRTDAGIAACKTWVNSKLALAVRQVRYYVETYGVRHMDLHSGNILWDAAATEPSLIDWGLAREVPKTWSTEMEAQVTARLTRSFLEGDGNICRT
ncbi:hypothetical protein ONZ45_g11420 [Pleurotus djamor]|nr:hypothetical protein ONZ45_g11420 [Pleurotus djamor]